MTSIHDGPASPLFEALPFDGNLAPDGFREAGLSRSAQGSAQFAPDGPCTGWGIPFQANRLLVAAKGPEQVELPPRRARWLVFLHAADVDPLETDANGFASPTRGTGRLGEPVADYVLVFADGSETRRTIRHRHEIGMLHRGWGENCFEAVQQQKPHPLRPPHQQPMRRPPDDPIRGTFDMRSWGLSQTRIRHRDMEPWTAWLFAWENPEAEKEIVALRVEPRGGRALISAVSAGDTKEHPLRWETRRKALLRLPEDQVFDPTLDERGRVKGLELDLGQVISAEPRFVYPESDWAKSYDRELPEIRANEVLVEYTAHPEARFQLDAGRSVAVAELRSRKAAQDLVPVASASTRVRLRVLDHETGEPVPVRLHAHGEAGEYLPPVDRHRLPNPAWFEDYGADCVTVDARRRSFHYSTYISGETTIDLPIGRVYLEISKGFEIQPVRKVVRVTKSTRTLSVRLRKLLDWRERGWVTGDTHVHFLSPKTAELEGSAEGVNVINLLASQWGELMTNVGDFDGKTTFGSREAGGSGEWLVRVGSENRQHVLGHISLLGYSGELISPMCSGGPDESALGDPVGRLVTEWARECRARGGIVVFPHFPEPRTENAAALVHGDVDAIELCSIIDPHGGIDPLSLSDWYRYLNCGYFYPCVGGTDKMAASTAVGTIRTYARIAKNRRFTYERWKDAIRSGDTFATYGPLLEFSVGGKRPGSELRVRSGGATLDVEWEVASVTLPMTRVELVMNGEIVESREVGKRKARGHWSVPVDRSSWLALLVRGKRPDRPEIIAAHSSVVRARVADTPFFSKLDAITILEQIEGAMAYLDTIGTRADERARKRMRLALQSAHRKLHNEMHRKGLDHVHSAVHGHPEHR